jgi:hypothetical protein
MPQELTLTIHVTPRSSQTQIQEIQPELLKVKLKAAPTGGKANAELIGALSKYFNVPKTKVEIIKGLTARIKIVRIYFY